MGCKYCTSGLGENCQGPLGSDDLEVNCDCDCHKCPDCGSAYCEKMGGPDPCEADCEDSDTEGDGVHRQEGADPDWSVVSEK